MSQHITTKKYPSPIGELILGSFNDQLCLCDWNYRKQRTSIDKRIQSRLNATYQEGDSSILTATIQQLKDYFIGSRTSFDIPLIMEGTEFQKKVWKSLLEIPYGKTETYLSLAKKLDNENAIRAVAAANGANAISIIIPCHRIIGSQGKLIGYAGGLSVKAKLLNIEGGYFTNQLKLF